MHGEHTTLTGQLSQRRKHLPSKNKGLPRAPDRLHTNAGNSADLLGGYRLTVQSRAGAVYGPRKNQCSVTPSERLLGWNNVRLAEAAADLVQPNEIIILDSGSSTEALARELKSRNIRPITVITNGLRIASELAGRAKRLKGPTAPRPPVLPRIYTLNALCAYFTGYL